MALIRGHHSFDDHFAQIPNDWLRDSRLSLEARGLLAQIMSHRPGWNLSVQSIGSQNKIGRDKVRRILGELFDYGYLERSEKQQHDEKGRLIGYDYVTRDPEGVAQEPTKAEPTKADPTEVSEPPKNTIPKKTKEQKTIEIDIAFDHFWSEYPRKKDKGHARRAFEKALEKTDLETILEAVRLYKAAEAYNDIEFIAYPATWLNGERWEDEHNIEPIRQTPGPGRREWVKSLHDQGEHFACEPGEFGDCRE